MGASDWAGRMDKRLQDEFGTCSERNLQLTCLIRWFLSNPDYEDIFNGDQAAEGRILTEDLPSTLRDQPGDSLETRWNHLMDELGFQELVDGDVYLPQWEKSHAETYEPDVQSSWSNDSQSPI